MKYRDKNGVFQELYLPPTGDTLPIGSVVDYDGTEVPYGYEEINNVLYENQDGTNQPIDIEKINDYKYIDVLTINNGYTNTVRIYKENYTNNNELISIYLKDSVFIIYTDIWSFTGITFHRVEGRYLYMQPSGFREIGNSENIKITKIIGYK